MSEAGGGPWLRKVTSGVLLISQGPTPPAVEPCVCPCRVRAGAPPSKQQPLAGARPALAVYNSRKRLMDGAGSQGSAG